MSKELTKAEVIDWLESFVPLRMSGDVEPLLVISRLYNDIKDGENE